MVHYHSFLRLTVAQRTAIDYNPIFVARPDRLSIIGRIVADLGNTHWYCSPGCTRWISFAMVSLRSSQNRRKGWTGVVIQKKPVVPGLPGSCSFYPTKRDLKR